MRLLSRYNEAVRLGAQLDIKTPTGTRALVPVYEVVTINLTASATAFVCDTLSGSFVVAGVEAVFGNTTTSGTLQVEVATGTTALGSGVNQLVTPISLAGVANTALAGSVVSPLTTVTTGSRVNVILGGTLTGLANLSVNVVLQRTA